MRENMIEEIREDPNPEDHPVLRRFVEDLCFGAMRELGYLFVIN
jgi:hypothetical protein